MQLEDRLQHSDFAENQAEEQLIPDQLFDGWIS
jgi:hypothetical protein